MLSEYKKFLNNRAKEMRKTPTDSEKRVKNFLDERKIPYKSQKVIMISPDNGYIVDFLLWKKIVLEIDGSIHESREAKDKDRKRTNDLEKAGYKVIRMRNDSTLSKNIVRVLSDRFIKLKLTTGLKMKEEILKKKKHESR